MMNACYPGEQDIKREPNIYSLICIYWCPCCCHGRECLIFFIKLFYNTLKPFNWFPFIALSLTLQTGDTTGFVFSSLCADAAQRVAIISFQSTKAKVLWRPTLRQEKSKCYIPNDLIHTVWTLHAHPQHSPATKEKLPRSHTDTVEYRYKVQRRLKCGWDEERSVEWS